MDGRSIAWLSYLPIPGLHFVVRRVGASDRLVRYHAVQGGWLVLSSWILVILLGSVAPASGTLATLLGVLVMLVLLVYLVVAVLGVAAALGGRFWRFALVHRLHRSMLQLGS